MSRIGELVLHRLCRPLPPDTDSWHPPTAGAQLTRFKGKFGRPVESYIRGHTLEIGSGNGILAKELRDTGLERIVATDHWNLFGKNVETYVRDKTNMEFVRTDARKLPFADESFDTVVSEDSFEHFLNPETVLSEASRVLRPGGTLLVTFGPPWYSPRGGHMMFLNPPPWFHLIFSDRTIFNVRARYRSDGVRGWTEGYSPLNQMSVRRFRQLARELKLAPLEEKLWAVSGLTLLAHLPLLREFFCAMYAGVWRK
jgi:SAM-dependent methyltransferase